MNRGFLILFLLCFDLTIKHSRETESFLRLKKIEKVGGKHYEIFENKFFFK